ncbi:MAG TPA: hypothetical protein VD884_15040 [Ohtaekwangia sp.]|nr:hypothetical protein [Ohtaekwangia sp.]
MQEIKKRRIVIASVLKPVNDTRMFEKLAQSLAKKFETHVIGFPAESSYEFSPVTPHTLYHEGFKRMSLKRLAAPWVFFHNCFKLKPTDVIVCTHELLIPGILLKLILGCRLLYDVQENYFRNILYTNAFPFWIKPFVAGYVRFKELILSPFVNHFILAEKAYYKEIPFVRAKSVVVENRYKDLPDIHTEKKSLQDGNTYLLFSGTLAETTGVFTAINLADQLHEIDNTIRLTIIGFAAQPAVYNRIIDSIRDKSFIRLVGGNRLVSHQDIIQEIKTHDFGIVAYPPNKSTESSIPTKLFEYLGSQLPMLLIDHPVWEKYCSPFPAAIPFSEDLPDAAALLHQMKTGRFYQQNVGNVFWSTEEPRLLSLF